MWTPRCSSVGVTLVQEEMDTTLLAICKSQVSLLNIKIGIFHVCKIIYVQYVFSLLILTMFCGNILISFLLSLSVPVDCTALRTRGLNLSLSCISVCVNQLLESTHAYTSLLTKQVATFLTKKHIHAEREKRFITLFMTIPLHEPRTLIWRKWKLNNKDALVIMFLYDIKKKNRFTCWEQNLFGSNKFFGSIASVSRGRIFIVR